MESSEKWLSGEYLVGVNGSGDWWTASGLGLLYGNEEHKGEQRTVKDKSFGQGGEKGRPESRRRQQEDSLLLIYCAGGSYCMRRALETVIVCVSSAVASWAPGGLQTGI